MNPYQTAPLGSSLIRVHSLQHSKLPTVLWSYHARLVPPGLFFRNFYLLVLGKLIQFCISYSIIMMNSLWWKQCVSWLAGFFRSQLIWIYTVINRAYSVYPRNKKGHGNLIKKDTSSACWIIKKGTLCARWGIKKGTFTVFVPLLLPPPHTHQRDSYIPCLFNVFAPLPIQHSCPF